MPHPRGLKIIATTLPILAIMLYCIWSSSNIPNEPFTHPKNDKNQTTIVESKIIVPAFLMNDHPRSHILRRTFPTVGIWYAGNSITNGAGSPANNLVFFKIIPEITIAAIPTK